MSRAITEKDVLAFLKRTGCLSLQEVEDRLSVAPCTCHPDDNPPVPCPRKYALEECRKAHLFDEADKFFEWGNAAGVALKNLLDAYERRVRR